MERGKGVAGISVQNSWKVMGVGNVSWGEE